MLKEKIIELEQRDMGDERKENSIMHNKTWLTFRNNVIVL